MNHRRLHRLIFVEHDKPERVRALAHLANRIPERQFWPLFGEVWMNSESLYDNEEQIRAMLAPRMTSPLRGLQMDRDDRRVLADMEDHIRVWRGCWAGNARGWSWTVSFERAKRFAVRFPLDGKPMILQGQVAKSDVLAYHSGRNESEIVAPPEKVRVLTTLNMPRMKGKKLAAGAFFHGVHSGNAADPDSQRLVDWITNSLDNPEVLHMQAEHLIKTRTPFAEIEKMYAERIAALAEFGFDEKIAKLTRRRDIIHEHYLKGIQP